MPTCDEDVIPDARGRLICGDGGEDLDNSDVM